MTILYVSLFQYFNNLQNFDFQCFVDDKNNLMKEKLCVHFSERTLTIPMREQKIKSMNKQITQSTLSMKAKIKSKPISLLNANENVLSNQ
jgi:pantothenate kinase